MTSRPLYVRLHEVTRATVLLVVLLVARTSAGQTPQVFTALTFDGDAAFDERGFSVSPIGDIDADEFTDFIIGAGLDDTNGGNAGSAGIYSVADGALIFRFDGSPGDRFGYSVSGAGDVDADGVPDAIVGAFAGSATVFSGADGTILHALLGSGDDRFGISVSGAGM